jgi:RHS repeat-associated protein
VTGPGGLPLEQVSSSGTVLYCYQDQLGSTRGLLDAAGTTVATYNYDAYGNLKSSTGSVSNPFQYAGQYTDSESGFQYLRARYYDPSTEQFLAGDPIMAQTGQPYTYAIDNPVNFMDPSGMVTAAVCVSVHVSTFIRWSASGCAGLGLPNSLSLPQFGVTGTVGGGLGSTTIGVSGGLQTSNAVGLNQLGGLFYNGGASVQVPFFGASAGGESFYGTDGCGRGVTGSTFGIGLSPNIGIPFEVHGEATNTWTKVLGGPQANGCACK